MKIHVSEPCKQLLPAQYKLTPRDEPELRDKVGGHASHFLDSKDGRQPLRQEVIKALLPTDSEMPKLVSQMQIRANFERKKFSFQLQDNKKKEEPKKDDKKADAPKADAPAPAAGGGGDAPKADGNQLISIFPIWSIGLTPFSSNSSRPSCKGRCTR